MKQKSPGGKSRSSSVKQKNISTANQARNSRKKSSSRESQKKTNNSNEMRPASRDASDDQKDRENEERQGFTETEQKALMVIFERFLSGKGNWEVNFDKFVQNHPHIGKTFATNHSLEEKAGFEDFISFEIFAVLLVYRHISLFEFAEDLEEFTERHGLKGDISKTYFDKKITSLHSQVSQKQSSKKEMGRKSREKKPARRSRSKNSENKEKNEENESEETVIDSPQKKSERSSRTKNNANSRKMANEQCANDESGSLRKDNFRKAESEQFADDERESLKKSGENSNRSNKNHSQTKKEENFENVSSENKVQPREINITINLNEENTIKAIEILPEDYQASARREENFSSSPSARHNEEKQHTPSVRGTPSNAGEREKTSSAFKLIPVPRPEQAQTSFPSQNIHPKEEENLCQNKYAADKLPIVTNDSKNKITDHFGSQKASHDSKPEMSNAPATSTNLSAVSHMARHEENRSSSKKGFPSAAHLFPNEVHRKERSSTSPMKKFIKTESPEFLESLHKSKQVNTEGKPRNFYIYQLKTVPVLEGDGTENIISATVVTASEGTPARKIENEVSAVSEFIMSNAKFIYEFNEGAESLPPWNSETSRIRQLLAKNSRNIPEPL